MKNEIGLLQLYRNSYVLPQSDIHFHVSINNSRRRALCFRVVRPSVRLSVVH